VICPSCGSAACQEVGDFLVCSRCGYGREELPYAPQRRRARPVNPDQRRQTTPVAVAASRTAIVSYLMNGRFHATRHSEDCGVLARARRSPRELRWRGGGFSVQAIYSEDEWVRLPGSRPPDDHSCVEASR
jgi:hypothetical protein